MNQTGLLAGQIALVTGATHGLGRAIAEGLAAEGAAVGVLGRDPERAAATADTLRATGARAIGVCGGRGGLEAGPGRSRRGRVSTGGYGYRGLGVLFHQRMALIRSRE